MPTFSTPTYTAVASGDTLTDVVDKRQAHHVSVWIPNSLDSEVFVQGGWDSTSSSNFARAQHPTSSGDWAVGSFSTARAVDITQVAGAFPYIRFELGAAATITGSFAVVESS